MNKLIVVTGGSKGIGRAIVHRFAQAGFDVATCARQLGDLKELQREVESKFKVRVYVQAIDLAKREQVRLFTDFVNQLKQPVDVLVNNTGFFVPGKVTEEPDDTLESMIEANVYSAYYTTRGLVSGMKRLQSGHIFNMC